MRFPSVSDISIRKPEKDGSTYFATFAYNKHRNSPVKIQLDTVICVKSKDNIYVRNKEFTDYMIDLNEHIIEIVKQKWPAWFKNNLNKEFIEESYVNPLRYDKRYGNLVKLGQCDVEEGKFDIKLEVTGLRFQKQKFNIVWSIKEITAAQDVEFTFADESDNEIIDDDLPEPIPEDVEDAKEKYTLHINDLLERYTEEYDRLKSIIDKLSNAKNDIKSFESLEDFVVIEDLIETLR